MMKYKIPMRDIITAIEARNIRASGGSLESYTSEKSVVTLAQFRQGFDQETDEPHHKPQQGESIQRKLTRGIDQYARRHKNQYQNALKQGDIGDNFDDEFPTSVFAPLRRAKIFAPAFVARPNVPAKPETVVVKW